MTFGDLEQRVNRELRRLPSPPAPHTLLPRVLAAVDAWVNRPWYERAWFTWPLGWQAASIALVALLGYAVWALPSLITVPSSVVATSNGASIVWRTLIQPFMVYAFGLIVLMCLACAAFGTALNYVFLERTADR